jgi:transposase-like protein
MGTYVPVKALPQALRLQARQLRERDGASYGEIARALQIAPGTARRWTTDIELTAGQIASIAERRRNAAQAASTANAERWRAKRLAWQRAGRLRARDGDLLHQAGCLLYWAEGTKTRNTVELANSDVNLTRLFLRFLSSCFDIQANQLAFCLHVYTGNGLTIQEIEKRWLTELSLPRSCLRKHSINLRPAPTSGVKTNKLPYGVATVRVLRSTWLVQHIYGAIQEYGGFDEPRWLD